MFCNYKWSNILLGQLFDEFSYRKNKIAFVKLKYSLITYFYEKRLVLLIIIHFLISYCKKYYIKSCNSCYKNIKGLHSWKQI